MKIGSFETMQPKTFGNGNVLGRSDLEHSREESFMYY